MGTVIISAIYLLKRCAKIIRNSFFLKEEWPVVLCQYTALLKKSSV